MALLSTSLFMTFDFFQPYCISSFCCTECSGAHTFSFPFRLRSRRYRVETSKPEKHCLRLPICFAFGEPCWTCFSALRSKEVAVSQVWERRYSAVVGPRQGLFARQEETSSLCHVVDFGYLNIDIFLEVQDAKYS